MFRRYVRMFALAAVVGGMALIAPAAQANVIDKGTYTVTPGDTQNSGTCDMGTADPSDDFAISAFDSGMARFMLLTRSSSGDYVFESQNQRITQTITAYVKPAPAAPVVWTAIQNFMFKAPLQLLSVNGDIETWRGWNTSHTIVNKPNGVQDYRFDVHNTFVAQVNTATDDFKILSYTSVGQGVGSDACADAVRYANS